MFCVTTSPWTLVVIGTDSIDSYKYNYHTITTTMPPLFKNKIAPVFDKVLFKYMYIYTCRRLIYIHVKKIGIKRGFYMHYIYPLCAHPPFNLWAPLVLWQ
jgi:hypothetical protein